MGYGFRPSSSYSRPLIGTKQIKWNISFEVFDVDDMDEASSDDAVDAKLRFKEEFAELDDENAADPAKLLTCGAVDVNKLDEAPEDEAIDEVVALLASASSLLRWLLDDNEDDDADIILLAPVSGLFLIQSIII